MPGVWYNTGNSILPEGADCASHVGGEQSVPFILLPETRKEKGKLFKAAGGRKKADKRGVMQTGMNMEPEAVAGGIGAALVVNLKMDAADLLRDSHLDGGLHCLVHCPPVGHDVGIGFAPHSDQWLKLVFSQPHGSNE